ncbi:hypothetical protein CSKR_103810 [Clonorchis sinensis]|uniref:Uncharacterized protein n=1 Tax=Clonorchis sinensis TaxID=79923 RepID=A0A3R7FHD6_CLOSI|nr:hypothetical protein CSKR_103810 [Clonorchis sinensis]
MIPNLTFLFQTSQQPPGRQNKVGAEFLYGTIIWDKFINYTTFDGKCSFKTNGPIGPQKYEPNEQTGSHLRKSHVHKDGHK